jgi:signal transduction histidine kinase
MGVYLERLSRNGWKGWTLAPRYFIVYWLIVFLGCFVIDCSWPFENQVVDWLKNCLGSGFVREPKHSTGAFAASGLLVLSLTTISIACGRYVIPRYRPIVILQLAAGFLGLSGLTMSWFGISGLPIALLFSIASGFLCGVYEQNLDNLEESQSAREIERRLRSRELQEAKLQLIKQDETERRLLAADLHDQVLNDLKTASHLLDGALREQTSVDTEKAKVVLNQAMNGIREIMDALCPSILMHLSFDAALEDCLRAGSERGGFKPSFRCTVPAENLDKLDNIQRTLLYRLVQESITNICKHAQASIARVHIFEEDGSLVLEISDDGKGINRTALRSDSRGLTYMQQRADLIGASIDWRPGLNNRGTTVRIELNV